MGTNVVRLIGMFLILIIGLVVLVRSTLQGATAKKDYLSVYFRIIMNHFQLLVITASFNF